jgi:hypothetical protein
VKGSAGRGGFSAGKKVPKGTPNYERTVAFIQSLTRWSSPQFRQRSASNWAPQRGQDPGETKASKWFRQFPHSQKSPTGGGCLQAGQVAPKRRGARAMRDNSHPSFSPRQQFNNTKAETIINQVKSKFK